MQQPVRCAQYFHNQAQVWSEKFNNASGSGRKIYCKQMLDEAIENDVQFQNVLRHYQKHGLGLVLRSWKNWGVVLRDPDHPTFYRFQIFNETGLVAHYVRNSSEAVLLEGYLAGFRSVDPDTTLSQFASKPQWHPDHTSYRLP